MLERRLFRRKSTGEVIDPAWLEFAFPTWYHYDVLRGLDHLATRTASRTSGSPRRSMPSNAPANPTARGSRQRVHDGATHLEMDDGIGHAEPLDHAHRPARARTGPAGRADAPPTRTRGLTRRATVGTRSRM